MSRIFSALHHAWLFINWLFSEEVHISLHVLKRPWEPSEVGARKGNTCYSCVGSCAPTESEARRARRVSWLGLDLARQGWLGCWGWRPSRTGTSCPASQVPASATAPFLDNYFNKIEFGSAFCQINMPCIQTWRSFFTCEKCEDQTNGWRNKELCESSADATDMEPCLPCLWLLLRSLSAIKRLNRFAFFNSEA